MKLLFRCLELLRTYILGDREIDFEFLSDQNQNFPDSTINSVNYEDKNLNVSIPVFSIHGNHDDIGGQGRLSSINLLSSVGYVNYFGTWRDLTEVEINPIVLQKRDTKLALYGLSHIHDARLARLFRDHKVKVRKPDVPDTDIFNLMVLHQNRADRGRYNYLPEDKLPGFLDLVVWGHEHDQRLQPEQNGRTQTYISQPGSSVATSLSEGESIEKRIGILLVDGKKFLMQPVQLRTVRPFIFRSINIDDFVDELRLNEGEIRNKVEKFFSQNVEEMIEESKLKLTGHSKQPKVPLIRLRVLYTNDAHIINTARFGQKFEERIANPESLLKFNKNLKRIKNVAYNPDDEALQKAYDKKEQKNRVEDVVESYFNSLEDEKDKLNLFSLRSLTEVCRLMVDKDDEIESRFILDKHHSEAVAFLKEKMCCEEDIPEKVDEFRTQHSSKVFDKAVFENSRVKASRPATASKPQSEDDDEDDDSSRAGSSKAPAARGGRGSRGGATTTRGRGKRAAAEPANVSIGLDVKKTTRGRATKQTTIPQATQRSQRSTKGTIYIDSSDSE